MHWSAERALDEEYFLDSHGELSVSGLMHVERSMPDSKPWRVERPIGQVAVPGGATRRTPNTCFKVYMTAFQVIRHWR